MLACDTERDGDERKRELIRLLLGRRSIGGEIVFYFYFNNDDD